MEQNNSNPVFVILGAGGGIGRSVSKILFKDGAQVALLSRTKDSIQDFADTLGALNLSMDATSFEEVEKYVKKYSNEKIVIKCGGRVLLDPDLLNSLIEDVVILKKLGLTPILVHGLSLIHI